MFDQLVYEVRDIMDQFFHALENIFDGSHLSNILNMFMQKEAFELTTIGDWAYTILVILIFIGLGWLIYKFFSLVSSLFFRSLR